MIEATGVYSLTVTFAIPDASAIQDGWLYIGPLPTQERVADSCDALPQVEVRGNSLIGSDAGDAQIWTVQTLPGNSAATTDQGAPLRITVH